VAIPSEKGGEKTATHLQPTTFKNLTPHGSLGLVARLFAWEWTSHPPRGSGRYIASYQSTDRSVCGKQLCGFPATL